MRIVASRKGVCCGTEEARTGLQRTVDGVRNRGGNGRQNQANPFDAFECLEHPHNPQRTQAVHINAKLQSRSLYNDVEPRRDDHEKVHLVPRIVQVARRRVSTFSVVEPQRDDTDHHLCGENDRQHQVCHDHPAQRLIIERGCRARACEQRGVDDDAEQDQRIQPGGRAGVLAPVQDQLVHLPSFYGAQREVSPLIHVLRVAWPLLHIKYV
eukprot:COSAG02_NODE_9714_length_2135_cov_1.393418_1_plen_210_part_10